MKPILSILGISLFLVFALASDLLDESSNIFVEPVGCADGPLISGTLVIKVEFLDDDGDPIVGAECKIFVVHQQVINEDCTSEVVSSETITLTLDGSGRCSYETPVFIHDNHGDLFRVDVKITPQANSKIPPIQVVKVASYNTFVLNFSEVSPEVLED